MKAQSMCTRICLSLPCLVLLLTISTGYLAKAQGAWPPARVNGDPSNPNRFSSNGKWYDITYVSTANNGTPQSTTPAYATAAYGTIGQGSLVPTSIGATVNSQLLTSGTTSTSGAIDTTVSGMVTISTNANDGTGGLDRCLVFHGSISGGVDIGRSTPINSTVQISSSPGPFITYKVVCENSTGSFGVQVKIAHGGYAQAFVDLNPPNNPTGHATVNATGGTFSASLITSSGGLQTNGSKTLVNDGASEFYQCNLTSGTGYFSVPLDSPAANINLTTVFDPDTSMADAAHYITPIQVVGP